MRFTDVKKINLVNRSKKNFKRNKICQYLKEILYLEVETNFDFTDLHNTSLNI